MWSKLRSVCCNGQITSWKRFAASCLLKGREDLIVWSSHKDVDESPSIMDLNGFLRAWGIFLLPEASGSSEALLDHWNRELVKTMEEISPERSNLIMHGVWFHRSPLIKKKFALLQTRNDVFLVVTNCCKDVPLNILYNIYLAAQLFELSQICG